MRTLISLQYRYTFTAAPTDCSATADIRRGIRARLATLDSHPYDVGTEHAGWIDRERMQALADLERWGVKTDADRIVPRGWERAND